MIGQPGRRRRIVVGWAFLAAFAVAAILAMRYVPIVDELRALRVTLRQVSSLASEAGLDLDRQTLQAFEAVLVDARRRFDRLADVLTGDPLVGLLRGLPATHHQMAATDALLAAGSELLDAAAAAMPIGLRYVEIREAHVARSANGSALAELVALMAGSTDDAARVLARVENARAMLARIPDGLPEPLAETRDLMSRAIQEYAPALETYVEADDILPSILGWGGRRRYLVLAQDPAELRPTGGFVGTFGIVTFEGGRITGHDFRDVYLLDFKEGVSYVDPPGPLKGHLLGGRSWQLADANWSPDFPTAARDALRLYAHESGDTEIDGVIGLTTYAIDRLLEVTGPIAVPEYQATVAAGETTLTGLRLTRAPQSPGENRKAFLSVFADRLLDQLLSMPAAGWEPLFGRVSLIGRERLATAWFRDGAAQTLVAEAGFDGAVRQDPGDYVYVVDANVAPTSKLNVATERNQRLDVVIDEFGNAHNTLEIDWANQIEEEAGRPYIGLPGSDGPRRMYGAFVRVLVPTRSRLESVGGGSYAELNAPELVGEEAGRAVFGSYVLVPPGRTRLLYQWVSPYPADADRTGGLYRLVVQKQPGTLGDPVAVTITVPARSRIVEATTGLAVHDRTATATGRLTEDLVVWVRYAFEE